MMVLLAVLLILGYLMLIYIMGMTAITRKKPPR